MAAAIILGAAVLALVAAGAYVVYRHTSAAFVRAEAAAAEFDRVRAQFGGAQPLVELRGVDLPVVQRTNAAPRRQVRTLHVLSYDSRAHKLVRVEIPGWMLEWVSARGTVRLANLEMFDDVRDRVTLEDIERHTPGIIVWSSGRTRVVVWTE